MIDQPTLDTLLQRVDALSRELEQLKRDLLRGAGRSTAVPARKPTLFGSVPAGDITDEMIEHARKDLFRELDDL